MSLVPPVFYFVLNLFRIVVFRLFPINNDLIWYVIRSGWTGEGRRQPVLNWLRVE